MDSERPGGKHPGKDVPNLSEVRPIYIELVHRLRHAGIDISDRRVVKLQRLIAARGDRLPAGLRVVDVAAGEMDWSRYNLENPADGNVCHPSEYGYRQIARQLAAALR